MLVFHPRPTFSAVMAIAILLSGCSVNGNFPDAVEPDAAKLRFISAEENTTLSFVDAEHCDGRTTGILNNLFLANTKRRANMTVAPPANAGAYLEVKLKPASELFVLVNSNTGGGVCGASFNFTPQSGSEYELTFKYVGSQCHTSLRRLQQFKGEVVRLPIPLVEKGVPSCIGRNALFPQPAPALPDTPERTDLFEQIIANSLITQMMPDPDAVDSKGPDSSAESSITERKRQIGIDLPESYWAEYRQNLNIANDEAMKTKARALQRYKDEYRLRLQRLDTPALKELAPSGDLTVVSKALEANSKMLQYYYLIRKNVVAETMSDHLQRMASLDKRYAVCEHYAGCWRN